MRRTIEADNRYRKKYFYDISTIEIERQDEGFEKASYTAPVTKHQLPNRTRVQEIMCTEPEMLDKKEEAVRERRILAVAALVTLCSRRENRSGRRRTTTTTDAYDVKASTEPKTEAISSGMDVDSETTQDPFPMVLDPRQCPVCIGDQALSQQQRTRCWHNMWNMWDHAEKHFQGLASNEPYPCCHPKCSGKMLSSVTHFKSHCAQEHQSRLRA